MATSAVVSIRELLKSSRRKPKKWVKVPSNTHGFWTNSRPNVNVVLLSILLSGNSKPTSTTSPSLTPQVTVVSSRWTPLNHHTVRNDSLKSHQKSPTTSRRLVTIQKPLLLSQSLDGTVIT